MLTLALRSTTKPEDKAHDWAEHVPDGTLPDRSPGVHRPRPSPKGKGQETRGGSAMDAKSTLKVFQQQDQPGGRGVTDGQTYQRLVGWPEMQATDRVRIGRATFVAGAYEQLHWHPIEACYYVISGSATVRNLEGEEFEVSAGSIVYAPAGIAGAHEWEVHDSLELLDIRATNETNRKMQFTVDKETKRSFIDLEDLAYRDAISFTSHY